MRHTLKLQFILAALCSITALACDGGGSENEDGASGSGGSGAGNGGSGGDAGPGATVPITNFETPSADDGQFDGYAEDTTRGWKMPWFTYSDAAEGKSPMGMITPAAMSRFLAKADSSRPGSMYVGNITGGNFKSWGAGMGFNFKDPEGPVSLAEFKGLSFWAKSGSATYNIKVKIVDARNTPAPGGTCVEGMDPVTGMAKAAFRCHDVALAKATLTPEWKRFDLTWDKFKPEGWGMTGFTGPDTSAVISVQFQVGTEASFDVSVDDVALIQ